ncbi:hypothetical protein CDD81_4609 [Ophiocordyceps australis]|uniref:Sensitive to high expression protein 9, mitochondrial n=1 Tax=Ophiocordyceps australis TaxID=1399860 RepID=A0A2C5XJ07_9HYPO|nr:hypothetical protein CDD81_4609 [Ophiocordyceps australis]
MAQPPSSGNASARLPLTLPKAREVHSVEIVKTSTSPCRYQLYVMQGLARPVIGAAWAQAPRLLLTLAPSPLMHKTAVEELSRLSLSRLVHDKRGVVARIQLYSTTQSPPPPPSSSSSSSSTSSSPLSSSSPKEQQQQQHEPTAKDAPNQDLPQSKAEELPSAKDSRRAPLTQKFSHVMDNLQSRVLTASSTLNDITGYSGIENIKADNELLEQQLADAQSRVRTARQAYKTSNTRRATTQRQVTTLLARKDSWSPSDLERFTELYRTDHVLEGEVAAAQEALNEAEIEEQSLSQRLSAGILKRYHEEQIWSDRIRRASTWGTWGLMGMNFVLFVVLQFVAEPWRRRRLVKGVVQEEQAVLEQVRDELEAVKHGLDRAATVATAPGTVPGHTGGFLTQEPAKDAIVVRAVPQSTWRWRDLWYSPAQWKLIAADVCSERHLDLRMKDASILALQGALAGATVAGGLALLLLRRT